MQKIMFTLPDNDELFQRFAQLKQQKFFDKSWAEMYRYLIREGLKVAEKESK